MVRAQPSETRRKNRTERSTQARRTEKEGSRVKENALEVLDGDHVRSGRNGRARGDEKRSLALRSFMKRRRRAATERIVTGTRTIANSANGVANVNYHRENRAGFAYFGRSSSLSFSIFYLIETIAFPLR